MIPACRSGDPWQKEACCPATRDPRADSVPATSIGRRLLGRRCTLAAIRREYLRPGRIRSSDLRAVVCRSSRSWVASFNVRVRFSVVVLKGGDEYGFQVNCGLTHVINNGHNLPRNGHIFGMQDIKFTPTIHPKNEWLKWPFEHRFADSIGVHSNRSF